MINNRSDGNRYGTSELSWTESHWKWQDDSLIHMLGRYHMFRRFYKQFELLNGGDDSILGGKVKAASCSKTVQLAGSFSVRPAELDELEIRQVWSDSTFTGSGWPHQGRPPLWKQQAAQRVC